MGKSSNTKFNCYLCQCKLCGAQFHTAADFENHERFCKEYYANVPKYSIGDIVVTFEPRLAKVVRVEPNVYDGKLRCYFVKLLNNKGNWEHREHMYLLEHIQARVDAESTINRINIFHNEVKKLADISDIKFTIDIKCQIDKDNKVIVSTKLSYNYPVPILNTTNTQERDHDTTQP